MNMVSCNSVVKVFCATLAASVLGSAAIAQTLTKLAPFPSQWGYASGTFVDANKIVVVGGRMGLHRSLDGGLSWTQTPLSGDQSVPLYNVTFLSPTVGIATGNSAIGQQDIFRTTNGGNTWTRVPGFPVGGSWYDQDYVSSTTGFISSNGAMVRTTDAGASFQIRSAYPDCPSIYGMDFKDANVGFVAGGLPTYENGIFKTTNGGQTWQLILSGGAADVIYLDATTLLAVYGSGIWKSFDGGSSWFPINESISTGLIDIDKITDQIIVGVSSSGDIWRTEDGGFNWTRLWVGEGDLPSDWKVQFNGTQRGVVAGASFLYSSTDGGATWRRLSRGTSAQVYGMAALDNDTVVTVGHHGYVQRMSTTGDWNNFLIDPPIFGRDTAYSCLSGLGRNFLYAGGHWGGLAKSIDGGKSWTNLASNELSDFYANDVHFTDPMNGWMVGWWYGGSANPKNTLRTYDGGLTWTPNLGGNYPGVSMDIKESSMWIVAGNQTMWRSTNLGGSFQQLLLPYNSGSTPSVAEVSFANTSLGYVAGYHGYLARSQDGGATWVQLGEMNYNVHTLAVLAVANELWICGAVPGGGSAFVKRSLDRGVTWTTWNLAGQYTTPNKMVRSTSRLFVSGYNGETYMISGLARIDTGSTRWK